MKNIAVSVIVPVYGVEKYIERCARSLFGQTMTDRVEFIFINDGTKDRSIELLTDLINEYPRLSSQVTIIHHPHNRGVAAARQTGLEAASGDYILHLDSDDYFEPDMLQAMYDAAIAKNADVVVADIFSSYKDVDKYRTCLLLENKEDILKSLIAPWRYGLPKVSSSLFNKLTKRSIYNDNNISFIEGINYGEDLIVSIKIIYHAAEITKIDRAFVHYNKLNPTSISHNISAANIRQLLMAVDTAADFLSAYSTSYNEVFDEMRFKDKLIAIAYCAPKEQAQFIDLYPWLDFEKHKHLVARHWRLPYKMALTGHIEIFNCMRRVINIASKVYRAIR